MTTLRFSANLGFLWADHPLLERIDHAARAGFRAVELHQPYDVPARALKRRCHDAGVELLAINTGRGPRPGDFGLAAVPGHAVEARALIDQALDYAHEAGAAMIHVLAGVVKPGSHDAAREALLANLHYALRQAGPHGLTLLLEALNPADAPDYFYASVDDVAAVIAEIGDPRLKILFDFYHIGRVCGNWHDLLTRHFAHIGHVQIASVPDRCEPDHGTLDYRIICATLQRMNWTGWIGAEYRPRTTVEAGLGWRDKLLG
jgi:2-dehydrotetronate isomerase